MRFNKILIASILFTMLLVSCEKDNDSGKERVPPRDPSEQEDKDQAALEDYLATHFYNYEEFQNPPADFDYIVRFDTLSEANADKIPLIESEALKKKTVLRDSIEYSLYILTIREGVGEKPTFADSTFVAYTGELLSGKQFDSSLSPIWFDLTRTIPGFSQTLNEFRAASGFEVNADNTVSWNNDYGIGAVFMPSGLGYFSNAQNPAIPPYSPLVFGFKLFAVNQADHDQDGIPSFMEDLNEDEVITNDDTDGDNRPNYNDPDDDNDFIPTREEIEIKEDGTIIFTDEDNNGVPDYLEKYF